MLQELIGTEQSGSDFTYAYRVFDNEDILLELDASNNIAARYTHGPGIDEPLIMEKGGVSFFYHADGLGSITEITNQAGTVVQRYAYSSFGKKRRKGVGSLFLDSRATYAIEAVSCRAALDFRQVDWLTTC